jgi:hypothetical protein
LTRSCTYVSVSLMKNAHCLDGISTMLATSELSDSFYIDPKPCMTEALLNAMGGSLDDWNMDYEISRLASMMS